MNKKALPALSNAQQEIMELVWELGEVSAAEIRDKLSKRRNVARTTVQTMMTRIHEKGWLTYREIGRTFLYSAAFPKSKSLGQKAIDLVDSAFSGSAEELMSALIEHRGISKAEAGRIRKMLDEAERSRKGRSQK